MRKLLVGLATVLSLGLVAETALAASPHFIRADASLSGDGLVVTWKEAGLGDNERIDYVVSAFAVREDSCLNGGGKVPSDPKKTTTSAEVSASGTFDVKNGSVNGRLELEAPTSDLDCPPGQRATLTSLSFSDVEVFDATNGILRTVPGTFS